MVDLTQAVWQLLTNPNISFLLLVLGLWSAVLAVSVPGTGVPEAAAVVSLALAAVGLLQLPFSLAGVLLLGLALLLFIFEFQVNAHGALLVAGGVALAVGALVVYGGADPSGARLSWVTVVAAPVVSTAFFAFLIRKGLAAQRAPALQDLGRLIGLVGEARTTIAREGSVYVGGELWSATADQFIPAEAPVVVVGRSGLVLKVVPAPQPSREQPAVS